MRVLRIAGCAIAMTALAVGCNEPPTAVDDVESALFGKGGKKGKPGGGGGGGGVTWLTNVKKAQDHWPSYSPDGGTLVFSRSRNGGQWDLFTLEGGVTTPLWSSTEGLSAWGSKWSAEGNWIVFTGVYYDSENNRVSNVWVISPNGTQAHQLVRSGLSNDVLWPSWYPDEDYLAVWDTEDRVLKRITCCEAADGTGAVDLINPVQVLGGWSSVHPNNGGFDVVFGGQEPPEAEPYGLGQSLWIVHDDLMNNPAIAVSVGVDMIGQAPGWSPDGQWLAFQSRPNTPETDWWNIWIVRPDGTDLQQITDPFWVKDALGPDWKDDTHLVFTARKNPFKSDRGLAVMEIQLP